MRVITFVLNVCLLGSIAAAQSAPSDQVPAQFSPADVQALLQRLAKLEQRVADLEQEKSGVATTGPGTKNLAPNSAQSAMTAEPNASPTSATASAAPRTIASVSQTVPASESASQSNSDQMTGMHEVIGAESDTYPNLKIRGFADVDFVATGRPTSTSGFNMGQFVLHFASPLSKKISFFGEVSLTAQPTLYNVDLERAIIRYDVNDSAKISFGRFHTPVNYWNTAFHHGTWLQTTVARPEMIKFGGAFIPVHFVGLQSEGTLPLGFMTLGYNAGIGNGRGSVLTRAGDNGDANNNRAWLLNIFARPTVLRDLQIGASVYNDKLGVSSGALPTSQYREWISSAHIVWTGEKPEVLLEFANVHHRNLVTGRTFDSQGAYAQFAYRLPAYENKLKAYYRYDWIGLEHNEPVFSSLLIDVRRSTLGMRYDISDFAAFKAEYRNDLGKPGEPRINGLALQTSFTF